MADLMARQTSDPVPRAQVHDALAHLHDLGHLQRHPLAEVARSGSSSASQNAGRLLRQALLEAIEALAPPRGTADPKASRQHQILVQRYVEGRSIEAVQEAQAIGRSHYFREHATALAAVAAVLEERWCPRSDFPPAGAATPGTTRGLPRPLTSFVGRDEAVAEVIRLLDYARLVTLTGPAGTGKTRLALEAAARSAHQWPHGLWFVPLASLPASRVETSEAVLEAVAYALGLHSTGDASLRERVVALLGSRDALLVMDNCEHVVPSTAATLSHLLAACPGLRVLATSRSALRVYGEQELPVPPLAVPDHLRRETGPEELLRYGSVRLFAERARAVRPDFSLSQANAAAVAEICRRLDGLPLALELAAARVRVLPTPSMLEQLDDRLALLSDGPRDLPARQRTLRDALGWSYDLLSPGEQALFRRLSTFVGGFTLEGVQAVALPEQLGLDPLQAVASLLEHSLLVRRGEMEPRYAMLETLREFGLEALDQAGESTTSRQRHAEYVAAITEVAERQAMGSEHERWMARIEDELGNVRAALAWCLASGQPATGLRITSALLWFWYSRGHIAEGHEWLTRLLGAEAEIQEALRAKALNAAALLGVWRGQSATALPLAEQSVSLWRALGDARQLGWSLHTLAHATADRAAERERLAESVAAFRATEDHVGLAWSLHCLGNAAEMLGDVDAARQCHEETLALSRRADRTWGTQLGLAGLGALAARERDYAAAYELNNQALALMRETGDRSAWDTLNTLGQAALGLGDFARAEEHFRECLALCREQGLQWDAAIALTGLGSVGARTGRHEWATRLFAAAGSLIEATGKHLPVEDGVGFERAVGVANDALGEDAFQAAWRAGELMTLEEATALALAGGPGGQA